MLTRFVAAGFAMAIINLAIPTTQPMAQSPPPTLTTEWLYNLCRSSERTSIISCVAYIDGIAAVLSMLGKMYQRPEGGVSKDFVAAFGTVGICNVQATDGEALRQIFLGWAERHPDQRRGGIAGGVMIALQQRWPCLSN